jgi:hypothetical protein
MMRMARIVAAIKRAILPITTKRIPAISNRTGMMDRRAIFGERLPSRNSRPVRKAATTNNMAGSSFTPIV